MSEGAYLTGRHVVVTGGGRGIGAAVATALSALGANLTLLGRDGAALVRHAHSLGTECFTMQCDVADAASIHDAFGAARARFGDPWVLVNNAGIADGDSFTDISLATWERILTVNLTGAFLCTQQVLPAMLAARSGRIINIASTAGLKGYNRMAAYCAAKHGMIGLTRSLAVETAKKGVTVNAVCPGYTDTAMGQQAVDGIATGRGVSKAEALALLTRLSPLGRLSTPEEVANAVAWLCSPGATAITGQAIAVAGGEVM
jgi:NAD(P)-dependent dehydrogenase (short-subunit alcohol dehydrogenase family)